MKNISLFVEPTPTNLELNNPKGNHGETVNLIAKLTDEDGNPITGKLIIFHIGDMTLTAVTNDNGVAIVQYTIDADDFTDGQLSFTAIFEGDDSYLASSATSSITLIEEPIPPEPPIPRPENKTSNNSTTESASASMKSTGIPINMILLSILSVLGILLVRKQN